MKYLKKLSILIIVTILLLSYESQVLAAIVGENDENTITKTLYTNQSVANMSLSGTNRGNWHDRQNLGIYMKAGASFEIRQTNLKLNQNLTLDCLNNDSQTEKTFTIPKNGDWVTISVDYDSVPFIKTLCGIEEKPTIEIKNLNETEDLTYYYYGDNEEEFFNKWNQNNHAYAVIENDRATFLVPLKDRETIVRPNGGNYAFKSIDEMLEYYHDFVEQFDRFLGLSYNTDNELDKNVKTKFFVKANKHGAGAAYYSGNHTAQNGDSISGYLSKGWLNLHEFGHGYEGSLANQDLALVDVMNNILSHYYQITFLNENDGGWLGKKLKIENNIEKARENTNEFNEFSYQQKLYFFVDLLDKIGPEKSMAYVHSKYREYLSKGIRYNASNMYAKSFSEVSGYNVIPYMNSWKIVPSEDIQSEIYEKELPMIYYLRDFVESDEKSEQIRKDLNLEGNYSLVSNEELEKYNMKGSLSLKITIDDLEQLQGKKLYIKDGKNIIKEILIENSNIDIKDLPVGIYTLQMPSAKTNAYNYSYDYVVIKENSNTQKEIQYQKMQINPIASDTQIQFKGLGDSLFASATMNLENKEIRIKSNNQSSHSYFTDEYANIQIFDKDGKQIYEKSYIGNVNNPGDDTIPVDIGYTIKIKHREPGRLIFQSQMLNQKEEFSNTTDKQTTYKITEYGLQKEGTSDEEQYEIYKRKVEQYITKIKNIISTEKQENKNNYFIYKNKLLSSILALNEKDKNQLLSSEKTLLNGSSPEIADINTINFTVGDKLKIEPNYFKANDLEDGEITLNDKNTKISFNVPNENLIATKEGTYTAQVQISDSDNNITTKDFKIIVNKKAEEKLYISSDNYKIEEKYISKVGKETKLNNYINNIKTNGEIKVIKEDGTQLKNDEYVGTGMTMIITKNGEKVELKISVLGDLSGDGKITATDLSTMNQTVLKTIKLDGEYKISADLDENGKITATDLSTMNKMVLKIL